MVSPSNGHEFEQAPGNGEGQGSLQSMGLQRVRHDLETEGQEEASKHMCGEKA